jgi:hypothetical protein
MDLENNFMKQKKPNTNAFLQELVDQYRAEVEDGPLTVSAIAIWILQNGKFKPSKEETIALLTRHLSAAMRTQFVFTSDGRRIRKKHAVRHKETGADGKKQMLFTWYDIELAPPHFMHESLQQRRGSIADICWQLKQDREGYNKHYNKGEPIPEPLVDFREDMEERQAMLDYTPPDESDLNL